MLDCLGLLLDGHRFRQILQKALVNTRAFFICGFIPQPIPHQTLDLITFDRSLEDYLGI